MPMIMPDSPPPVEELPEHLGFRFEHGPVARSLREFAAAIAAAPVGIVHAHRAHYAPWVRECLREEGLARRLEAYAEDGPAPDVYRDIVLALVSRRLADAPRRATASR